MKSIIQLFPILIVSLVLILLFFIPEQLATLVINKIPIDTVGHIIGFFGLTWLLVGFIKLPLFNTVVCLFFYSALTEISQYYLGFRNAEFIDVVADVIGVALFAICYKLLAYYQQPHDVNN